MSRVLSAAFGTVGLAVIGFSLVVATVPDAVSSVVPIQVLTDLPLLTDRSVRALAFGVAGMICLTWIAWTPGKTRSRQLSDGSITTTDVEFRTLREEPPEETIAESIVGEQFDQTVLNAATAAANGSGDDPARSELRSLAVAAIVHTEGYTEDEAKTILSDGSWTTDEVAAAYVADREASLSLRHRFFAWLRPSRTKYDRINRSLRAIKRREQGRY